MKQNLQVNAFSACITLSVGLLLTACATPNPEAIQPQLVANRIFQQDVTLQGRLAVQYEEQGKRQSLNANFSWQQSAQQTRIVLAAPTGQALAEMLVTPEQASITTIEKDGPSSKVFANVTQMTKELLGWPLPVAGLRDWLQGFGTDAQGQRFIAPAMQDSSYTTNEGWHLRYASWHDAQRPKRIDLDHHIEGQAIDVSLRLVLEP